MKRNKIKAFAVIFTILFTLSTVTSKVSASTHYDSFEVDYYNEWETGVFYPSDGEAEFDILYLNYENTSVITDDVPEIHQVIYVTCWEYKKFWYDQQVGDKMSFYIDDYGDTLVIDDLDPDKKYYFRIETNSWIHGNDSIEGELKITY